MGWDGSPKDGGNTALLPADSGAALDWESVRACVAVQVIHHCFHL